MKGFKTKKVDATSKKTVAPKTDAPKKDVSKKRSRPEAEVEPTGTPHHDSTSQIIGQFHTHLKTIRHSKSESEKSAARDAIEELGGMAKYQELSLLGFDASVYVIGELMKREKQGVVKLLDVGAIVERYPKNDPRVQGIQIVPTSIDLYSQDKNVQQIDFFDFCKQNKTTFDAAVLSLVLNYVASPLERGKMLLQAARMVRRGGYLFLVLPVSCISNSRYLKFSLLKRLLSRVGFNIPDDNGYKTTDKFFSCVAIRGDELVGAAGFETEAMYKRKLCRGGKDRNNFCILLPTGKPVPPPTAAVQKPKVFPEGAKNLKTTSNQRKRARMKKKIEAKREAKKPAPTTNAQGEEVVDFSNNGSDEEREGEYEDSE